jgi:RHS repeat-associated protein
VAGKNNYQLTGKEFENDFDLGWSDHGMRRYDPAMARWTSADPLMGVFADMSPYNYVMGNPVGLVDPDGAAPVPTMLSSGFVASVINAVTLLSSIQAASINCPEILDGSPTPDLEEGGKDGKDDTPPPPPVDGARPLSMLDIDYSLPKQGNDITLPGARNGMVAPLGAAWGLMWVGIMIITIQ